MTYVGETGQNVYTRGLSHMANYRRKHPDSPLWKHAQMGHGGAEALSFSMKVVKTFKDPLTRQINEAVRISNCSATTQLNSKTEWHGQGTVADWLQRGEVGVDFGFGKYLFERRMSSF